ncbi:MAG: aminopeptidase [Pseudomonadota bacterium]
MAVALLLVCTAGCETLSFYRQAIGGQLSILLKREPVEELLNDPSVEPRLRQALERSQRLLEYAETTLALEPTRRYRSYVGLERPAVVYNLIATAPLSIEPERWCYPIVGCAPYRGYFASDAAERAVAGYRARGFTTYLGRVPAYSTLGWFADPLLSTFVYWREPELLELMAHELAHTIVWVRGDVAFNESFASFVGQQVVRQYFADGRGQTGELERWKSDDRAWSALVAELLHLRSALRSVYRGDDSAADRAQQRDALYAQLRQCYEDHRAAFGNGRYDGYLKVVNDAALAVLSTYQSGIPAFEQLFRTTGQRWSTFFPAVQELVRLDVDTRNAQLKALAAASADQQITHGRDNASTDEVQCKPFASHAVDGNPL